MFAHMNNRRIALALATWFAIVFVVSYFSLGRTATTSLNPSSPNQPKTPVKSDRSALRKPLGSASADTDHDGLPDAAELSSYMDRQNFRSWFTRIAETQFYEVSPQWNLEQRDCAGLARFAWREALR